jgi:uncharacterized protein YndB with AHSA1/START domain
MGDQRIEREIVIEAPPSVVWRVVTEPDQITRWFADHVTLEAVPGGRGSLVFDHPDRASSTAGLVVERVEPPRLFSFRWGHPEGETPTRENSVLVEFTLTPTGDERTLLRVVESGLGLLGWPAVEKERYREDHLSGWDTHLGRLAQLTWEGPEFRPTA